ncbi:hypothetical protein [Sulfuriflexus mobilis]|uniref:hypothetical protein n=1 Tax=Sulfuriflexus mobilis TaxID=1811807 RepID=UPI000F83F523|nr:hypothetical protein [Sulfuriflexus mobilis]
MNKQILLLRLSYWSAAIADFGVAIMVLIPERMGLTEIVYPMGLASAIAFSWGVLLLVADRKPVERKWVLIPTILVVGLLTTARLLFSYHEMIGFSFALPVFGIALITLMAYSYFYKK